MRQFVTSKIRSSLWAVFIALSTILIIPWTFAHPSRNSNAETILPASHAQYLIAYHRTNDFRIRIITFFRVVFFYHRHHRFRARIHVRFPNARSVVQIMAKAIMIYYSTLTPHLTSAHRVYRNRPHWSRDALSLPKTTTPSCRKNVSSVSQKNKT